MTLTLQDDDFDALARSSSFGDAMKEPDFITRAMKLFSLREGLWNAFDRTSEEIDTVTEKRADKAAGIPALIGFGLGIAAGIVGMSFVVGIPVLAFGAAEWIFGGGAGLVLGLLGGFAGASIGESGPRSDGREAQEALEAKNKKIQASIESAISDMDSSLFSKDPAVRDEFRSAFRHAALKLEVRENRLHRAKMEHEAEEAADAAQTAATMSTIAAVNASMAAMNSHR